MVWIDFAFIIIIILSALFSLLRGFVREILSLVGWFFSYLVALRYSYNITGFFEGAITNEAIRNVVAFGVLFIILIIAFSIFNHFIAKVVRLSGMGMLDRGIGAAFGALRGVVIVAILVTLGGATQLALEPSWMESVVVGTVAPYTGDISSVIDSNVIDSN